MQTTAKRHHGAHYRIFCQTDSKFSEKNMTDKLICSRLEPNSTPSHIMFCATSMERPFDPACARHKRGTSEKLATEGRDWPSRAVRCTVSELRQTVALSPPTKLSHMSAPAICTADLASHVAVNWETTSASAMKTAGRIRTATIFSSHWVVSPSFRNEKYTLLSKGEDQAIVANVTVEGEIYDSAENRSASSWRGR